MDAKASCPDCGKPVAIHGNRCYSCAQRKRFSTAPRQTKQQEIDALRQQLADLKAELAGVGLPEDAGVAGLIRHHRGNAMAAGAIEQLGADLKEIADLKAERDRYREALRGECRGCAQMLPWLRPVGDVYADEHIYHHGYDPTIDAVDNYQCELSPSARAALTPSPIASGEAQ